MRKPKKNFIAFEKNIFCVFIFVFFAYFVSHKTFTSSIAFQCIKLNASVYFLFSNRSYLYFLIFPLMSFPWNNLCFDGNWRQKDGGIIYDSGNMSVRPAPRVLQTLAVKEKETIRIGFLSFFPFSVGRQA